MNPVLKQSRHTAVQVSLACLDSDVLPDVDLPSVQVNVPGDVNEMWIALAHFLPLVGRS